MGFHKGGIPMYTPKSRGFEDISGLEHLAGTEMLRDEAGEAALGHF